MAIRTRSIGELLDGAFRLYRQDLGLYMLTAIVASIPLAIFGVFGFSAITPVAAALLLLTLPFALIGTIVVWAALMLQMNERLDGREPTFGPSIRRAMGLIFRFAWAGFLAAVVIFGALFLAILAVVLSVVVVGLLPTTPGVVVAIVAVVLNVGIFVVLGLRVLTGTMLCWPGIVVEDLTGYQSFKRGFAVTKGGQGRILSVLFLSNILVFVPVLATYFVTGTWQTLVDPAAVGLVGTGQLVTQQILLLISTGFTTPFLVACILLLYFDQRVRLEAYDLQAEADALTG